MEYYYLPITTVLMVLIIHFVADFVLQTDYMAINKSKSWSVLALHVVVYSLPFIVFMGLYYAAVNAILHFIVDAITSRVTSYLWSKGDRHNFFVVIGLDQLLHSICLISTIILV